MEVALAPRMSEQVTWEEPAARPGSGFRLEPLFRPLRRSLGGSDQIPVAEGGDATLRRDAAYRRTLAAADVLAGAVALIVAVALLGPDSLTAGVLLIPPLLILAAKTIGLYDRDEHLLRKTTLDEAPKLFQIATLTALLLSLGQGFFVQGAIGQHQIVGFWAIFFVCLVVLRATARQTVSRFTTPERCLVLGDTSSAEWLCDKFRASQVVQAKIVGRVPLHRQHGENGRLPLLGDMESLGVVLSAHEIDRVIIAPGTSDSEEMLHAIRLAKALGAKVTLLPRLFEVVGSSVEFDDVDGATLLAVRRHGLTHSSRMLKRGMDVAGSLVCLMTLAPLFAVFAAVIRLTSSGPVFFRQPRIGERGEQFEILKFRTMYEGSDALKDDLRGLNEVDGLFKIPDDPRVTTVGRFLRRSSLDELPQLINVLRGKMSLVGPRPLVPDEDRRVEGWHRRRLIVKPGMTGIWQILGSARIPLHEMVKIDYLYGANWSVWLDIKVMLRTVPYVLLRRGL
jgi:exopolysaccharide biosynthesis polyprenyl glycosylphosphotransferase